MSNLGDFFSSFYSKFVLRDLCGKVVPGSIVLFALVSSVVWQEPTAVFDIPVAGWVIIYGLAWIAGFAVQALGEKTGGIRYYPKILERKAWEDLLPVDLSSIEMSKPGGNKDFGQRNWLGFYNCFHGIASDAATQQRERFVVIKEGCGNSFMALIVLEIMIVLDVVLRWEMSWDTLRPHLASGVLLCVLTYFLFVMHRLHVNRQFLHMLTVLKPDLKE